MYSPSGDASLTLMRTMTDLRNSTLQNNSFSSFFFNVTKLRHWLPLVKHAALVHTDWTRQGYSASINLRKPRPGSPRWLRVASDVIGLATKQLNNIRSVSDFGHQERRNGVRYRANIERVARVGWRAVIGRLSD